MLRRLPDRERRLGVSYGTGRDVCRRAVVGLEPTARAPRQARTFVTDACQRWDLTSIADEAALAVSELVTNAVLHARTHIEVSLCVAGGKVELAVRDDDPRPPILRPVRTDLLADLDALAAMPANGAQRPPQQVSGSHERIDERHPSLHVGRSGSVAAGRGLLIVDALADEWGVAERADGKEVWLKMAYSGWSHIHDCDCDHTHERSASGMPVHHQSGPWDLN